MSRPEPIRRLGHMVVVALLIVATSATSWSLYAAVSMYHLREDKAEQDFLRSLAWALTATLGILLILLVWSVLRWMKLLMHTERRLGPTQYVDAWAEAGRRMQVPANGRRIDVAPHPEEADEPIEAEPVPDETADEFIEYTPEYHERLDEEAEEDDLLGEDDEFDEDFDDEDFDEDDEDRPEPPSR